MTTPKMEFRTVSKTYPPANGGKDRAVLKQVSFAVPAGKVFVLFGPSGSGKSTCLRMANQLDSPDNGEVLLDGTPIAQMNVQELRRRVALVFQLPVFFEGSVQDNIAYSLRLRGVGETECVRIARETIARVGLDENYLLREAVSCSPGEQQRVSIARALAASPEVLLLDEPTASLDPNSAKRILYLLKDLRDSLGLTVVLVIHQLTHAREIGDEGILLSEGGIAACGPVAELLDNPANETMRRFIAGELEIGA